ncbi:tRNA (adenosine(37)-N6)-threonylcarbamoyltransferase complex ATPase subunit type 1 TsaE [Phytoactinopolyspora limicola]|uniref:tRNA (adenosine(37)-N6)-threonylcarbamoyltransferase complex ATPase subunit type 1 TsaE n=1 Tax=Phytoactinopolyspora limicola TaxID=2715536 RepID=UPI0014083485|nr:tRNA (adenosine(37)-N6)-threonylcarbamoyltransferase complex ATPase subunit type 1 TsaE [Phytoactinopolyspora limicola]
MIELDVATAAEMSALGRRLGPLLRAGDLVLLGGGLGAGKTTFTQGLGEGLGVRGPITSPTFMIARVHPSLHGGVPLVHVDAYRLGGWDELEDLDLEATLDEAVTVVEWGEGLAEGLAGERLEIHIERSIDGSDPGRTPDVVEPGAVEPGEVVDPRRVRVVAVGERWASVRLDPMLSP